MAKSIEAALDDVGEEMRSLERYVDDAVAKLDDQLFTSRGRNDPSRLEMWDVNNGLMRSERVLQIIARIVQGYDRRVEAVEARGATTLTILRNLSIQDLIPEGWLRSLSVECASSLLRRLVNMARAELNYHDNELRNIENQIVRFWEEVSWVLDQTVEKFEQHRQRPNCSLLKLLAATKCLILYSRAAMAQSGLRQGRQTMITEYLTAPQSGEVHEQNGDGREANEGADEAGDVANHDEGVSTAVVERRAEIMREFFVEVIRRMQQEEPNAMTKWAGDKFVAYQHDEAFEEHEAMENIAVASPRQRRLGDFFPRTTRTTPETHVRFGDSYCQLSEMLMHYKAWEGRILL